MSFKKSIIVILIITVFIVFSIFLKKKPILYKYNRILLGTIINVSIIADSEADAVFASEKAFNEIERIEGVMSSYREETDIFRINQLANVKPVKVFEETYNLIRDSQEISKLTNGSFDITFASLSNIWNFRSEKFKPPKKSVINKYLPLLNYRNIILDPENISVKIRKKGTKIGLGGIAKGYAIGRGIEALKGSGIKNSIVEAGGDLQVTGKKYNDTWKIGLRHPRTNSLILTIDLHHMDSIASSGDYERYVIYKKQRYHHIIDPKTGYPAKTFVSVSVVSKNPVDSDAFATAIFVMGEKRTKKLLKERKDLLVIFIDLDLKIYGSRELKNRITLFDDLNIEWI